MNNADTIAEALAGTDPIAVVGQQSLAALWSAAAEMGFMLASVDATALVAEDSIDALATWKTGSKGHWMIVVENAERAAPVIVIDAGAPRCGEDVMLDLAFDGHPSLPGNALVVLAFAHPTELSDSLADDAIPCAFVGDDDGVEPETQAVRLAA